MEQHRANGEEIEITQNFTYDHGKRLIEASHQINEEDEVVVSTQKYNELGQLSHKKLHGALQQIDYDYNIRGWLTGINNPNSLGNDLFAMQLDYETGTNPQFNGNISSVSWSSEYYNDIKQYEFEYDALNRLTAADYTINAAYSTSYTYDKNGNISHLSRNGIVDNVVGKIDDLTYVYHGNQLLSVNDGTGSNFENFGFKDNGIDNAIEYLYDANGNMYKDDNKGIEHITYNHLNLPASIQFKDDNDESKSIGYIYTANGSKLRKHTHDGSKESTTTDYIGAFVYENTTLQFIQTSEGRLVPNEGGGYNYEYALKDHLGNTRVMFSQTGEVLQDQSYYPFGMSMGEELTFKMPSNLPDNKYLYNEKELQDDFGLGWYDYGNRFYDPKLGRWHTQDLMAEFYNDQSPYNYVTNDPINHIDPNGDFKTKFGAWLWKTFNGGGEILQDKGGEYFVSQQQEYEGEGAGIAVKRTFDREGRSEGKDLKFEAQKEAFLTHIEFKQSMKSMGVSVTYTNDINEARQSMLQIPSMVLLPNVLKATSVATSTTKIGISSVDDLLKAAGELKRVKGAKQGFVNGNAQDIFNNIVKVGSKVRGNLYRLKDGTLVNLHKSTKTGVQTIDINKAGQVFKIRVQ